MNNNAESMLSAEALISMATLLETGSPYSRIDAFPNIKKGKKMRFADCLCGAKHKTLYYHGDGIWLCLKCVNNDKEAKSSASQEKV